MYVRVVPACRTKGRSLFLGSSPNIKAPLCHTLEELSHPPGCQQLLWPSVPRWSRSVDLEGALLSFPAFSGKLWEWFSSFACASWQEFFLWQVNLFSLLVVLGVTGPSISLGYSFSQVTSANNFQTK